MQLGAFNSIKEELSTPPGLALYNAKAETIVSADASSFGLGAVLLQRQENGHLKPVAYNSRAPTDTEKRYAQIENETDGFQILHLTRGRQEVGHRRCAVKGAVVRQRAARAGRGSQPVCTHDNVNPTSYRRGYKKYKNGTKS
ncbi:hypothetical protein DPEC_G00156800 [Dallia pectoralis]|uniref:Uncharacterized protein n=1 Tax=Dallia pectoralis TaxID=75939 RepID=A0ACC2GKG2_DALPE|nr:hypothetical protein DPEC_G00156800 [Dallia pectoralis]